MAEEPTAQKETSKECSCGCGCGCGGKMDGKQLRRKLIIIAIFVLVIAIIALCVDGGKKAEPKEKTTAEKVEQAQQDASKALQEGRNMFQPKENK